MSNPERRNSVALDDAFNYCRMLETARERPVLIKLCNAIRTLDLALENHAESPIPITLSTEAWSRVRNSLFNALVTSFAGHLDILDQSGELVEPGGDWPENGTIEFFPELTTRRSDSYLSKLDRLDSYVSTAIRWAFAEGRRHIRPADFNNDDEAEPNDYATEAIELLEKLNELCAEQATQGKKKAHRKWWQLYWEATGCPNKQRVHELKRQMTALEGVWGKPAPV